MNTLLAVLTVITFSVCGPGKYAIQENLSVEKPSSSDKQKVNIYKKVPTKWVKITKKSN